MEGDVGRLKKRRSESLQGAGGIKGMAALNGTLKGWQRCRKDKTGPDQRERGSGSVTGMYRHCTKQCGGSEAEAAAGVMG